MKQTQDTAKARARLLYETGNDWCRRGDFMRAQNCYLEAVALDADSPAAAANEMLESIMALRHKDYYNP